MSRLFTFAFAIALVATACTGPTTSPPTSASAAASATAQPITRGGTAIVAIWQEPSTLGAPYGNQTVLGLVINGTVEGLVDTSNDGQYVPTLAAKVPDVANGGGVGKGGKKDVTLTRQKGIKWAGGGPPTSAGNKFTRELSV